MDRYQGIVPLEGVPSPAVWSALGELRDATDLPVDASAISLFATLLSGSQGAQVALCFYRQIVAAQRVREFGARDCDELEALCALARSRPESFLALADDLGHTGDVVGVDVSAGMLRVARSNARAAGCRVRFTVGDACALNEPDGDFDVVRAERTLQWIAEPLAAVAEMARVVRALRDAGGA